MKKKILVVDDNDSIVNSIKDYFASSKDVEVSDTAKDGIEAIEKLEKNQYDCVLLDIIMPKKDGLYVLKELKSKGIHHNIIVITSFNEQETIRMASEYGAKFFLLKPFDYKELESRIMDATKERKHLSAVNLVEKSLESSITKILHSLGIPSHIKGYQYIRDAIKFVYDDPNLIGGITKELYPMVGNKYSVSTTRVERSIRHAIEVSWNRGDWELMEEIFGHSVDIDKAKPTNSEFIVTIADKLRLDTLKVYN